MIVHFAGLGSMGLGMATCLVRSGHQVFGVDPAAARMQTFEEAGGHALTADSPNADALVCVVLNAAQTRAVLYGENALADRLRPGGVILSCATLAPAIAVELEAEARTRGLLYLDAPISGGSLKAVDGCLTIMASGQAAAFDAAAPLLEAMAETVHRLGDAAGPGSAMKAVNQLLVGVHIAAMSEALAFAASQGLDLARVVEVISSSAGHSWIFGNRAPHVLDNDYTPRSSIDIWPKDLGIVTEIARAAGLPLPVAETALAQFRDASAAGLGAEDDAALTLHVAAAGSVDLPGRG